MLETWLNNHTKTLSCFIVGSEAKNIIIYAENETACVDIIRYML